MKWEEQAEQFAGTIPVIVDWVAIVIFLAGFAKATTAWIHCEVKRVSAADRRVHIHEIRLSLGSYILLGLEVMIISDVVHSCVHPDLMSLAELGALVLVRTFISFFLGKEQEALDVAGHLQEPRTSTI